MYASTDLYYKTKVTPSLCPFDHPALFLWLGQFFGLRQVFEVVHSEELEESFGGAVEDGAAGFFGSAGDVYQVFFHEGADGFAAGYASDGFDVGSQDGLFVGDDCEGFEGGLAEFGVGLALVESLEDIAVLGEGEELVTTSDLLDAEGAGGVFVLFVEILDGLADGLLAFDVEELA
ncbi:MAG: hypothetical protein JWN40_5468 [Phycisphaerales bacterium]|nr:hypothetical protein [Phycisphaerales bacterium]